MTGALRYEDPEFFYGNLGNPFINEEIVTAISKYSPEFEDASVLNSSFDGRGYRSTDLRDCRVASIGVNGIGFIQDGLTKIVENVNDLIWKRKLIGEWESTINVIKYNKPGHHFKWHNDADEDKQHLRSLSVVYSLTGSSDYTGGEFSFRRFSGEEITFRFERGDFIVFPSHKVHMVHPLKTGTRCTLVGWYR